MPDPSLGLGGPCSRRNSVVAKDLARRGKAIETLFSLSLFFKDLFLEIINILLGCEVQRAVCCFLSFPGTARAWPWGEVARISWGPGALGPCCMCLLEHTGCLGLESRCSPGQAAQGKSLRVPHTMTPGTLLNKQGCTRFWSPRAGPREVREHK